MSGEMASLDLMGPPPMNSRRSGNTADAEAARVLDIARLAALGQIEPTEADEAEEPGCLICHGAGWLAWDVPIGDPRFGQVRPCACALPGIAARELERLCGAAEIPPRLAGLSFASYARLADGDQAARSRVEAWTERGDGSLYLYGEYGVGKTGLALPAFRRRIETQRVAGLFRTSADLLASIRATFDREVGGATTSQVVDAITTAGILLLDDLGVEKPSAWTQEELYRIVNTRYLAHLPTIYTSNYSPKQLAARVGPRVAWRIVDECGDDIVPVVGANQRDRKRA